jgi:hypothetical protein
MKSAVLLSHLFAWHYRKGLTSFLGVLKNIIWFEWNFFSIDLLFQTLFSKWRRLGEEYTGGFNMLNTLTVFTINTLMRIFGAFIRTAVIVGGLTTLIVSIVLAAALILIWLLLPAVLILLVVYGIIFIV